MNMNASPDIKINLGASNSISWRQSGNGKPDAKFGDIIKATVVKLGEQKATLFVDEKFSFEADTGKIKGNISLGDELYFEVLNAGKNSISLKQVAVDTEKQTERQMSADEMKELFKQQGLYQDELKAGETYDENQKKTDEAIASIRRRLSGLNGNAAKSSINELIAHGLSLEKISFDMLNTVMREAESKERIEAYKSDILSQVPTNPISNQPDMGNPANDASHESQKETYVPRDETVPQKNQTDTTSHKPQGETTPHKSQDEITSPKPQTEIASHKPQTNTAHHKPQGETAPQISPTNENFTPDIVEILKIHGLSESRQNTARLESVAAQWDEIKEFNDEAIVVLLRAGRKLTLENIYKAKYSILAQRGGSASSGVNAAEGQDDFYILDGEIEKFLKREGFAVNAENMDISRVLVKNDIALNAENLNKALFLRGIREYGMEKVMELACENIKNGKRASDIEIFSEGQKEAFASLMGEYDRVIETIPKVTTNNIEHLIRSGRDLTLRNLSLMNFFAPMPKNTSEEAVSAKRRLVEIQYKLTNEAALRLANKNININILPIQEALETLKNIERQEYEKNFRMMGVPATEKNIEEITELYDKVKTFKPLVNNVFGDIITRKVPFSVNGIHESIKTADGYGAAATKADAKYGDNFSKVTGQFANLLNKLDIEATEENVKAAMILSKSGLDVNAENIMRVRNIDIKISDVYDKLHPFIAADMINNNLNPANMHIDEILEYIEKFDGAYGSGVKEKIANYIMDLDNANIVSDITRQAIMSVYRMLGMIQKDDSAALGVAVKKDSEMTLASLFSDAKYYQRTKAKKTDIDMKVDDTTEIKVRGVADDSILRRIDAVLEENIMAKTEENIRMANDIIDSEVKEQNRLILGYERVSMLLKEISSKASATALGQIVEENPDFLNMPFEEFAARLKEKNIQNQELVSERYTRMMSELNDIPPRIIMWLDESGIPATINNMIAAANMLKKPHYVADKLNETKNGGEDYEDADGEISALNGELINAVEKDGLLERLPAVSDILTQITENTASGDDIRQIALLQNALRLQNHIHRRPDNSYFQIPVKLHDRFGALNMYILNENADSGNMKLYLSLDTPSLGNVSMYLNITGDDVKIKVCAPDAASLRRLTDSIGDLRTLIAQAGFDARDITFEARDEKNILEDEVSLSGSSVKAVFSELDFAV